MPRLTRAVRIILISTCSIYVVQLIAGNLFHRNEMEAFLGLHPEGVLHGRVWQFVTYIFLHDPRSIMHILMNMFCLYFVGPDVERALGLRRFLLLYFGCGILGGIGWLLLTLRLGAVCMGASGAVFGVLGAFAALFPSRQITLLLFFVLPLTMTARFLAIALGLVSLAMLLAAGDGIAHAAHLGGGLAGYLYTARLVRSHAFGLCDYSADTAAVQAGWTSRLVNRIRTARNSQNQPTKAEVDRILEKVYESGMNSLTKKERDTLDRASGLR